MHHAIGHLARSHRSTAPRPKAPGRGTGTTASKQPIGQLADPRITGRNSHLDAIGQFAHRKYSAKAAIRRNWPLGAFVRIERVPPSTKPTRRHASHVLRSNSPVGQLADRKDTHRSPRRTQPIGQLADRRTPWTTTFGRYAGLFYDARWFALGRSRSIGQLAEQTRPSADR